MMDPMWSETCCSNFNMRLLDFYATQILTFTTVLTECIGWLIKVTIINEVLT